MSASEKLKALDGATPAPWKHIHTEVATYDVDILGAAGGVHIARQIRRGDAALIAALRNALPQIVAVVEAAENKDSVYYWDDLRAALSALESALS